MTSVYVFRNFRHSYVIMLHINKALQKQAEALEGVRVYEKSKDTLKLYMPTRESILNSIYGFCKDNGFNIREMECQTTAS